MLKRLRSPARASCLDEIFIRLLFRWARPHPLFGGPAGLSMALHPRNKRRWRTYGAALAAGADYTEHIKRASNRRGRYWNKDRDLP